MESSIIEKPKLIKTISIIIIIIASIMMFSNFMGIVLWVFNTLLSYRTGPIELLFFLKICLIGLTIGTCFLIGGIKIRKYKKWSAHLISFTSIGCLYFMWDQIVSLLGVVKPRELEVINIFVIILGLILSSPFVLLIIYLNKTKVMQHLE